MATTTSTEAGAAFDLTLTESQALVQRTARDFATEKLLPIAHDIDQQRLAVVRKRCGVAVDRHGAHFRSPDFLRADFFAIFGIFKCGLFISGLGDGPMAPATSVRSMISRSLRKAASGCMFG